MDCLNLRQNVHKDLGNKSAFVDLQEYRKTRNTIMNAHLLARMHKLSIHHGLGSEDSAGLSS